MHFVDNYKEYIFALSSIQTSKPGTLNFTDLPFPFVVNRLFTLDGFDGIDSVNNKRGFHGNENFDELIVVNKGCVSFEIIDRQQRHVHFILLKNQMVYIPRHHWLIFEIMDRFSSLTVLANKKHEDSISQYDFNEFLKSDN